MAEFKTIMTGWKDICARYDSCDICPIYGCNWCGNWVDMLNDLDENTIVSIESAVLTGAPTWVSSETGYTCSICNGKSPIRGKYCPNCGRKMLL